MKKYVIFIAIIFSIGLLNVNAAAQTGKLTCTYKSTTTNEGDYYFLEVKYNTVYVGPTMDHAKLYLAESIDPDAKKRVIYEKETTDSTMEEQDFVNFRNQLFNAESNRYIPYSTYGYLSANMQDNMGSDDNYQSLCPDNFYINEELTNGENKYTFYACEGEYCSDIKNYVDKFVKTNSSNILSFELRTASATEIDNMFDGENTSNVQEQYNSAQQEVEMYCNEELSTYDKELCAEAKKKVEDYVDQGEDVGISEEQLKATFHNSLEWEANNCSSYLGVTTDPNDPAYYLSFAFKLLKYLAIIVLFVFTIIEYAKAIAASDDKAIKKATQNTIKRLIIAVIIFFLPTLIEFILDLLDVVTTDPTCGIK